MAKIIDTEAFAKIFRLYKKKLNYINVLNAYIWSAVMLLQSCLPYWTVNSLKIISVYFRECENLKLQVAMK